jgi:hypothetical protein
MIRIASGMVGVVVVVACVCWSAGMPLQHPFDPRDGVVHGPRAVARDMKTPLDHLAMSTGIYISQARACKTDEWKRALRESMIQVQKREQASNLKYFQLVVEWASRYEALGCEKTTLLAITQAQRTSLETFIWANPECKLSPDWSVSDIEAAVRFRHRRRHQIVPCDPHHVS